MRHIIGRQSTIEKRKFKCTKPSCGVIFESDEWKEQKDPNDDSVFDFCPRCQTFSETYNIHKKILLVD